MRLKKYPTLSKLLAKKVKSATEDDLENLEKIERELMSLSRKMQKLVDTLEDYVDVPTKVYMIPMTMTVYAGDLFKERKKLEKALKEKAQSSEQSIAKSSVSLFSSKVKKGEKIKGESGYYIELIGEDEDSIEVEATTKSGDRVGYANIDKEHPDDPNMARVGDVEVEEGFQGMGVGTDLYLYGSTYLNKDLKPSDDIHPYAKKIHDKLKELKK